MSLVHELEKSGNWLFRRRNWLPVIIIALASGYLFIANRSVIYFSLTWELICIAISLTGEVIRSYTLGHLSGNLPSRSVIDQLSDELNTSGVYSVLRHPVYVGNFFVGLGPILFLRSVWCAIIYFLLFWVCYERIIFAEEQFLRRKFGETYDIWAFRVRAVIPGFRHYTKSTMAFSFRKVLKREYNRAANLFIVFAVLDIMRNLAVTGKVYIEPLYLSLLITALIFWAVISYMVKRTKFLNVEVR